MQDRPLKALIVHGLRIAILLVIAVGMKSLATQRDALHSARDRWLSVQPEMIKRWIPSADRIESPRDSASLAEVKDQMGRVVGFLAMTQPQAENVIGYRGPSNALLVFDPAAKSLIGVKLLESRDTPEHVAHVLAKDAFFEQFQGWSWSDAPTATDVDAVSGATLTSLAIAEGILVRLGGRRPHLRFPEPVKLEEIQAWLPRATELKEEQDEQTRDAGNGRMWVIDAQGNKIGWLLRSGTLVESLEGYQGPTEVLMWFDLEDRLQRAKMRRSYDNEPYINYVQDESSFWKRFRGLSIQQLAAFDRQIEGVDGVSGATMTSHAVVDTMALAAKEYLELSKAKSVPAADSGLASLLKIRWTWNDVGTGVVLLFAILISSTRLRGRAWIATLWAILLIGYFGLCTGNLVSQALLVGWASAGVPWRLAPGLVAVVFVAMFWPSLTKQNVYCHQLCPHGAAQRLVKGRLKVWKVPASLTRWLRWIPGGLLIIIVAATVADLKLNVASLEPFDAYVWSIAGLASVSIAVVSLVVSAKVPMAYCKFGCPTGRLLEYSRRNRQSDRWAWQDTVGCLIAVVVWGLFFSKL